MNEKVLENYLRQTFHDLQLSQDERVTLRELNSKIDIEKSRYIRNRAFEFSREQITKSPNTALQALKWLEQIVKALDSSSEAPLNASAFFSPGDSIRDKLCQLLNQSKQTIDICVFTIADDLISAAIAAAHKRNVAIHIITDNDKSNDVGSDIAWLKKAGIQIVTDVKEHHMHHKFAVFDNQWLVNGSFNWTRSATVYNYENIAVSNNAALIKSYQAEFTRLWQVFYR